MQAGVLNSPVFTGIQDDNQIEYKTAEDHASLSKEDFMNLFVMQLQYQDPMNPMDSEAMASQMSQFNMVDLMYKNNEAMEKLVESDAHRTGMSAVSMIGHQVMYQGSYLNVSEDGPAPFEFELESPASSAVVVVYDAEGQVVNSWDMGAIPGDRQPLVWDGTDMNGDEVAQGRYRIDIQAVDDQGDDIQVTKWTTGTVTGVSYEDSGLPLLQTEDGEEFGMDEILKVNS